MRHGHLSDSHGSQLSPTAASCGGTQAQCPAGHYSNLFAAGAATAPGVATADKNAICAIAAA